VPDTHEFPRQQPGQVSGVQVAGPQIPGGWQMAPWQFWHACPPKPQATGFCPTMQTKPPVVLSQQPSPQLVPSHVVTSIWQVRDAGSHVAPGVHAAQIPPKPPHAFRSVPLWHVPLASQQPAGQVSGPHPEAVLQARVAALQLSIPVHSEHARPPPPHAALVVPE
jgi:hypothetical protein